MKYTLDNLESPKGLKNKLYKFFLPHFYRADLDNIYSWSLALGSTISSYIVNMLALYGLYSLIFK